MLQCIAACCSVLQCVAVHCIVRQCVAVCCSVLQCVAVCCVELQCTSRIKAYGMASVSRIDKIIGLFSKRALYKRQCSAKETYNLIDPTDRSHPITRSRSTEGCEYFGTGIKKVFLISRVFFDIFGVRKQIDRKIS